jgi:hypothetical protein
MHITMDSISRQNQAEENIRYGGQDWVVMNSYNHKEKINKHKHDMQELLDMIQSSSLRIQDVDKGGKYKLKA